MEIYRETARTQAVLPKTGLRESKVCAFGKAGIAASQSVCLHQSPAGRVRGPTGDLNVLILVRPNCVGIIT